MSTYKHIIFNLFAVMTISACASDTFITHNGNMPNEERISKIQKGLTKDEVLGILGTPSTIVSLDQNTWIYMSSKIKKVAFLEPEELSRDVLTIKFDKFNQVSSINRMNKDNGSEIAVNENITTTKGSKPGFFAKYFGGVGQYLPFSNVTNTEINK